MPDLMRIFSMQQTLKKNDAKWLRRLKKADYYPLLLCLGVLGTLWCIHVMLGKPYAASSVYNTYTLQAMAWRSGSLHLPQDYPWLELAIYEGNYYVSFPPLPSVVLLPLTFLFGSSTPDNLLVKLYALMAVLGIYFALKNAGNSRPSSAMLAYLFALSSSALPMMVEGAVWYQPQMLALGLMSLSVMLMLKRKPTPALFLYALSVCCRPFDAVYGPMLYLVYLWQRRQALYGFKDTIKRLIPGTILGLMVAAGIAVFNYVRFHNPLEFGHNYLPEFSFQGGVQFSLSHVANNAKTFLFGSPLSWDGQVYTFNQFGYSLFLACPVITLMLIQCALDLFRRRFTWVKGAVVISMAVHIFLLLLHRTFGGYQLGARYVADCIPYAVCCFSLSKPCGKRNAVHTLVLLLVFVFTLVGVSFIHL